MDKQFGDDASVDELLSIRDALANEPFVEYLTAAGWASAEAALAASRQSQEERHQYLAAAVELWRRAGAIQHERNVARELGGDHFNANSTRIKLMEVFVPLMRAMVDGDVTRQIRDELYDNMLYLAALNASALQDMEADGQISAAGPHIGLAHELNGMLAVNRLRSPTLIAMPATSKAGSGAYNADDTHDIDLLHLQWGQIMGVTTLESKAKPRKRHYERYKAAIINGRIHLYRKNSDSPIDTVVLFMGERDGILTPSETKELDTMTDTVFHLARHQLYASSDVPLHCEDVTACEIVPRHRSVANTPRQLGRLAIAT